MPLSPAIDASMMQPAPDEEKRLFEEKFGQMAYQVFNSQFPDLVESIVTFKMLDSDVDNSSAVGTFVLEHQGQFLYAPVILADNQLKPLDMMYVKDRDIFLPLNAEWVEEVSKGSLNSLGEGMKLPDTVATDVDIRNVIVPPTTGRYSYASVDARTKLAAEASVPLGLRLHKFAQGGYPGAPTSGSMTDENFDPEIWATFVDQYNRIQGTTPGQSLDSGSMDLETLAKMYKSHTKTWEMANNPALAMPQQQQQPGMAPEQGMPQQGMPQQGMPQQGMPQQGMMRTADVKSTVAKEVAEAASKNPSWGSKLDSLTSLMGAGAAGGAAMGGVRAGMDQELSDVPGGMIRGAIGGAIGAPIGRALGTAAGTSSIGQKYMMPGDARTLGSLLGGATGGFIAARGDRTDYNRLRHPMMSNSPYGNMTVKGSDHSADIKSLIEHVTEKKAGYKNVLPDFLARVPNAVKTAFAKVLEDSPALLKLAGDTYGAQTLIEALTPVATKTAGMVEGGGALYIADKDTPPKGFHSSFGDAAPEAFNGVLLRGYHFKDTRPSLNLAVQTQEYADFHDTREPGVYILFPIGETPEPALVITEPYDLLGEDRPTFPHSESRRKNVKVHVPRPEDTKENESWTKEKDVERSHKTSRMFILGDGGYGECSELMGTMIAEIAMQDTAVFNTVMSDGTHPPKSGKGMFIKKRGIHYFGTQAVELSEITTNEEGVIRGTVSRIGGLASKKFVIDPKSPIKKPMRPRGENIVVIPADCKWLPLKERVNAADYMRNPSELSDIMVGALGSMGVSKIVARKAGQNMYAVDGERTNDKVAALTRLATKGRIHASAAEAMLKIAEAEGVCRAYIVTPHQFGYLRTKVAQIPAPPQGMAMPPQEAAPPMPPAMTEDPAMQGSAVDTAFQETMGGLQQQISELQAQLTVLQTVQERAMQIEQEDAAAYQGGMDPNMAQPGMDPGAAPPPPQSGMDPNMGGGMPPQPGMDPNMGGGMPMQPGMDPSMGGGMDPNMDPNMAAQQGMEQEQPPLPIMNTENPSSTEIASQINPAFLEQAGQFQQQGAFDAGAVGSLAKTPALKEIASQYSANLEDSVDDLGRTLLTLYMQEGELKDQLGDEAFTKLETQLRDTFKGLGDLTLNLSHNSSQLHNASATV